MKKIFTILMFVWLSVSADMANSASVSREPLHGFYVGGTTAGKPVYALFQDWNKAASAKCGGDQLVHPTTIRLNENPSYPSGYLVCWYPEGGGYDWGGSIVWSDACPNTVAPNPHNPTLTCSTADEKPPCDYDKFGNPVIFSTRSKVQVEDDYAPAHRLRFSRFYNSNQSTNQLDSMSPLWRHTYSRRLYARQWSTSISAFNAPLDYYYSAGGWYPRTAAGSVALLIKPRDFPGTALQRLNWTDHSYQRRKLVCD